MSNPMTIDKLAEQFPEQIGPVVPENYWQFDSPVVRGINATTWGSSTSMGAIGKANYQYMLDSFGHMKSFRLVKDSIGTRSIAFVSGRRMDTRLYRNLQVLFERMESNGPVMDDDELTNVQNLYRHEAWLSYLKDDAESTYNGRHFASYWSFWNWVGRHSGNPDLFGELEVWEGGSLYVDIGRIAMLLPPSIFSSLD